MSSTLKLSNQKIRCSLREDYFTNSFTQKKNFLLCLVLFTITILSTIQAQAICRNPDGTIDTGPNGDRVYSANNFDGSCSNCDYSCSMPIFSPGG